MLVSSFSSEMCRYNLVGRADVASVQQRAHETLELHFHNVDFSVIPLGKKGIGQKLQFKGGNDTDQFFLMVLLSNPSTRRVGSNSSRRLTTSDFPMPAQIGRNTTELVDMLVIRDSCTNGMTSS